MIHTEIPKGFEIEWRPDKDFRIADGSRRCSTMHCHEPSVAVLYRKSNHLGRIMRKFCCPEHMYGREIRDGKVMVDRLVEREASDV